MAPKNTFKLNLPTSKPVEVYTVTLRDGTVVTRTLDQLLPVDIAEKGSSS